MIDLDRWTGLISRIGHSAEGESIRVYPHFKSSYLVLVPPQGGAHGGADEILNRSFAPLCVFIFGIVFGNSCVSRWAQYHHHVASVLLR